MCPRLGLLGPENFQGESDSETLFCTLGLVHEAVSPGPRQNGKNKVGDGVRGGGGHDSSVNVSFVYSEIVSVRAFSFFFSFFL